MLPDVKSAVPHSLASPIQSADQSHLVAFVRLFLRPRDVGHSFKFPASSWTCSYGPPSTADSSPIRIRELGN
jgi:hypothetical protein